MNNTLSNSDNYKKKLDSSNSEIFNNYSSLINEYSNFFIDNTFIQKQNYFNYVYLKGIETISSVFKILLLYTKNLPLTIFHCQKSFYYYIEFIGQIGDSNHQFLQLNSKDATLFVFKKTVFEINSDHRKIFSSPIGNELEKYNFIEQIIRYCNSLIKYALDRNDIIDKNIREQMMKDNCDSILKICNKATTLIDNVNHKNIKNSQKVIILNNFVDVISTKECSVKKLLEVIEFLHKKVGKNTTNVENILKNIYNSKLIHNLDNMSNIKFVNWLIS
tara:strand:+ start:2380 stop:3204 length:825 start_codon:yes stop_codon:yes gene_type:complete